MKLCQIPTGNSVLSPAVILHKMLAIQQVPGQPSTAPIFCKPFVKHSQLPRVPKEVLQQKEEGRLYIG